MNATHTLDHLQAITHVTSLLNSNVKLGNMPTVNKPKTAASSHYDPTGQEVAATSTTSYEGVNFGSDGSITGGSLSHESSIPGGNKLSTTSIGFGSNGKPGTAQVVHHNNSGEGDFKHVQMDMSEAIWNESLAVASGQIKLTTLDAATGQKAHDGALQFDKEVPTTAGFTHYDPDKAGAVTGFSKVDYSGAKFSGSNIVGGQYNIATHSPANVLQSTSVVTVSPLGRVQSVETTNMGGGGGATAAAGAVSSKVAVDFSKMTFNARNGFQNGDINYTATDEKGALLSQTTITYKDANPSLSVTQMYKNGQVQSKIVVDYAASQFNNDHQVVSSTKKVETYSADGKLLSTNVIAYDAKGIKTKEAAQVNTTPPKAPPPVVKTEPPPPMLQVATGSGLTSESEEVKTQEVKRKDGTLEKKQQIWIRDNKPASIQIWFFDTDGTTIKKTTSMDLSGLNHDPFSNTVTGAMNMQTHDGNQVLHAASTVQY